MIDAVVEEAKEEEKQEETKAEPEKKTVTHTVVQGESLWRIAQKYLGDGSRYREIIEANKDAYPSIEKNPNLIYAGWQFKIVLDDVENEQSVAEDDSSRSAEVTDDSTDVTVVDNSKDANELNQTASSNWTTQEKIDKLQECLDAANRALLAQKQRIADLNQQTVKFMIDNGFMKQEDWMAMNPPVGYTYVINSNGKIELVNAKNVALTADEIKALDSKLADSSTNNNGGSNAGNVNVGGNTANPNSTGNNGSNVSRKRIYVEL